jgi:hypothetical protein
VKLRRIAGTHLLLGNCRLRRSVRDGPKLFGGFNAGNGFSSLRFERLTVPTARSVERVAGDEAAVRQGEEAFGLCRSADRLHLRQRKNSCSESLASGVSATHVRSYGTCFAKEKTAGLAVRPAVTHQYGFRASQNARAPARLFGSCPP